MDNSPVEAPKVPEVVEAPEALAEGPNSIIRRSSRHGSSSWQRNHDLY